MKLGDKVTCAAVLCRRTRHFERRTDEKYWDRRPIDNRQGIYIGARTLSNGERWWEDEIGMAYDPKEYFRAALVVFSEYENPVYVPLDALTAA